MAIINGSIEREYATSLGIDTTSQAANTDAGFVRIARNADLPLTAGLIKRRGYETQLSTPWGTNSIIGGISFKKATLSTPDTILYNSNGTLANLSTGTAVDIKTGLATDTKPSLFQFDDRLFFYNGADAPFIYDGGSSTRQVGITGPTVAPTKNLDIAGGLDITAGYVWFYTYFNSVTKAESSPSDSLSTTAPSGGVRVAVTPGDSATADTIRIYRTVGNGSEPILDGEVGIADTTFDSILEDALLGVALNDRVLELDNSRITDHTGSAEFAIIADNRVFLKTDTNEVRFSKIGQSGPMPESFELEALASTESRYGSSDPIVGLGQIKDRIIVLKQRSIGFLEPTGLNSGLDPIDNVDYVYREISDTTGAISHFGGTQVYSEYVFLGRDNVYATDGISLRPVGNSIQDTVKAMGFGANEINRISTINDTKNKRIYIAGFVNPGAEEPSFILVGDYQLFPNFRWTTYTAGDDVSTHPGLNVGSFFTIQDVASGSLETYFTDSRGVGQYYQMNTGDSDDGNGIFFEVVTRGLNHGQPLQTKLYKDIEVLAIAASKEYSLQICTRIDFTPVDQNCHNITVPVEGGLWETTSPGVYNWASDTPGSVTPQTLIWAGEQVDIVTSDSHLKGKHIQYVFRQTEADAPVTLIAWGSVASIFTRE